METSLTRGKKDTQIPEAQGCQIRQIQRDLCQDTVQLNCQKLKEFITTRLALQKLLKGLLQAVAMVVGKSLISLLLSYRTKSSKNSYNCNNLLMDTQVKRCEV